MGVKTTTCKTARPSGVIKTRTSPRRGSIKYRTRSRDRYFWYTDADGVVRMVKYKDYIPEQVNDYIFHPSSFRDEPTPISLPAASSWPPRLITDVVSLPSTSISSAIQCVGSICPSRTSCTSPTCGHTLSAWKTATADWESSFELRATPDRGIGVFTKRALRAGTIIGWYPGAVVPIGEVANPYLMELELGDGSRSVPHEPVSIVQIDAEKKGAWTRFINHSCNADSVFRIMRVGQVKIMAVETVKDVRKGKELSVDYGRDYYSLYSARRCACGAKGCIERVRRKLEEKKKKNKKKKRV